MLLRLLPLLLLIPAGITAQINADTFEEKADNGIDIFVKNNEFCPVTFVFKLNLTNMSASPDNVDTLVVPARTERFLAYQLRFDLDARTFGYGYEYTSNFGDHTSDDFTQNHLYELPFAPGTTQPVSQGYNGRFSHRGALSLDFDMPTGTPVHAARAGVVAMVEEQFDQGCPSKRCEEYTNEVVILHSDGTFGEYVHLRQNGAFVEEGDQVEAGQLIGESGATGFANGPHLHFSVYRQKMDGRTYVPTAFRVADRQSKQGARTQVISELLAGQTYRRPAEK